MLDISTNGCRATSSTEIKPGLSLKLSIFLQDQQWPVRIDEAVVRWVEGQSFGLEFVGIRPAQRERATGDRHEAKGSPRLTPTTKPPWSGRDKESTGSLEFLVVPEHLPDIRASFTNPWHLVLLHTMHSCIVGRQCKREIAPIEIEELEAVWRLLDVLNRIVHVNDAQRCGCIWCQLHEPYRTLP